jgi:uncharacterized protein (DUF2267 family)
MSANLTQYYTTIQEKGLLRTTDHAQRWSTAVLRTLGLNLSRGAKKQLAKALPEELAFPLTRIFWLLHFRNTNLTREEFQKMVARRSGNSDGQFARYPVTAVFHGLKMLIDDSTSRAVEDSLSPELREMWKNA